MAAPIGHGIIGMLIARRMGVRSPAGLAAAFCAANIPDLDIPAGWVLRRDVHRGITHTPNFALTAGMLAGAAGLVRSESIEGSRDLTRDALLGAAVVGSHLVLDRVPYFPELHIGPKIYDMSLVNWIIDSATWAAVAYLLWPREQAGSAAT
jgi:membrane-bound metal-dependent hydrolase YbcI (DUF457 family)